MRDVVNWILSFLVGALLIVAGWKFTWILLILYVLICFLLIVVVLLQSGKAADLAGAFGGSGSQTAFGPRGAANFLTRATTWCAVMFMLTSMALVLRQSQARPAGSSVLERTQPSAPATPQQTTPSPAPAGQPSAPPASAPPAQPPAKN